MNAQQGFSLTFDLATSTWGLDYAVLGDTACTAPFFTVRIEGPYEVGAPSATVPGANDARFAFTKKTITPHVDTAAQFLSSAQGCGRPGFAVSQASDVTDLGCAALGQYPRSKCAADYDVVAVSGDVIRFGERPADNDMCTEDKRPKALSQVGSRRVR